MLPRLLRPALLPVGIIFGIAVEWAFYDPSLGPALSAADLAAGCTLIACGAVAWDRRPESRAGALMTLAGTTWFLGNVASALLYLHRGPLVHLYLSYPTGRLSSRLTRAVVAIAYVDAVVEPLASNSRVTLVLSGVVTLTALRAFAGTSGSARKAAGPALAAALAYSAVLALGALSRQTGWPPEHALLWIYDLVIAATAVVLLVDLLRARWAEAVVTGLVVELGSRAEAASLRTTLAKALGDPSLEVGYRLEGTGGFVDDGGRTVELPAPGSGRTVTPLVDRGEQVAVLVHDEALLADRRLIESVRRGRAHRRGERRSSGRGPRADGRGRGLAPPDRRSRRRAAAKDPAGAQPRRRAASRGRRRAPCARAHLGRRARCGRDRRSRDRARRGATRARGVRAQRRPRGADRRRAAARRDGPGTALGDSGHRERERRSAAGAARGGAVLRLLRGAHERHQALRGLVRDDRPPHGRRARRGRGRRRRRRRRRAEPRLGARGARRPGRGPRRDAAGRRVLAERARESWPSSPARASEPAWPISRRAAART